MVERFKDTGHPVFRSIGAFSCEILKKKNGRDTIHFNTDASNTELLFRIIHSVNQLSIYGAVSNWCEQFGRTEEEKGQEKQKESVTKDVLTCVKSQEVKLLVSLQNKYLEPVCGKTIRTSNHWPRQFDSQGFANSHRSAQVSAGMNSKTRPDEDDGFGQIIPYCREYILSRAHPQSRIFAALPGGTIIGPVIEVQIVKIIDHCGFEIAVPSPNDRERTFYVMISRGKSRFVDEVHIPNAELRSSADLLIELQKAEGEESCLGQSKTSIQETSAAHGSSHTRNKETCADTLNILPSEASLFHAKNHSYDWEEVDLELMVFFRILYNVKEYIFHRCCSFRIQSILENGLIPGGHESDKGRQTVFFTPLNPFGGDSDEEEPCDDYTVLQNVHHHSH